MRKLLSIILIIGILLQAFCITAFAKDFKDIEGHWAQQYVERLIYNNIMNGYEDGTFRLNKTITRAEFTKLIVTMRYGAYQTYEDVIFSDVANDKWYYPYTCTAYIQGIADTEKGREYRPNEEITREEMVLMIVKSLKLSGGSSSFKDVSKSHKHYAEITSAVGGGILTGYEDGTFKPEKSATRGETAAMVCRMLDYISNRELTDQPSPVVSLTEDEEIEEEEPTPSVNYSSSSEKIIGTWQQIYNTGVTSSGAQVKCMNVISPTWFKIVDNTGLTPYSYEEVFYEDLDYYLADFGNKEYIKDCKNKGYKVWPMIGSESTCTKTSRFMKSEEARKAFVARIKEKIKYYDLDGINLDFEYMFESDKDLYSQFVKEMADMCHSVGVSLSVDVTKYLASSSSYSMCYDRTAIGKYADYVMLMGYDQNGTWSKTAGSVADLPWTEDAIKGLLKEVPAEKLVLGIPFYTRIWETWDGEVTKSSAVGIDTAESQVKENMAEAKFDSKTKQNYAEWGSEDIKYVVWLEDSTSIKERIDLVNKYNLAGVMSWSKEFGNSDAWSVIDKNLNR